jgi:DNA (cytosine-5)-methyltransferase 1
MKSIELFSGAGGMALGLDQAGFESVALYEWNARACQALTHNRPTWNIHHCDVREIDFKMCGNIDLVAGGPPCQPFSMGGKARGYDDHRDMFPQAVRAVRELQPSAFMFENVKGLMRSSFSNYVEFIRLQLTYPEFPVSVNVSWETNLNRLQAHHSSRRRVDGLKYQVSIHQADAADYGVPQRRHRVFFIGFRSDVNPGWSFPKPTHSLNALLRAKYIDGVYWENHEMSPPPVPSRFAKRVEKLRNPDFFDHTMPWKTVRDALQGLPDSRIQHDIPNHCYQSGARAYPGHTGSPFDEPSKALKAGGHGVPGGENMLRYLNGKVRYFTVRESARIQTFPDDFVFPGSWTESMRQLGNAVPVELARIVADSIFSKISPKVANKA